MNSAERNRHDARTSDPEKLRVVLAGCGAVARLYYTPALLALERAGELRVAGLIDPSSAALESVGRWFPAARQLASLDGQQDLGADLVIVASPPHVHAEQAIHALRAGSSVLCEKPMATSTTEAEAMIQASRTARRHLAIGLVRRFLPATQAIRSALANGLVGELRSISVFEGGPFSWPVASLDYFDPAKGARGVLLDIGVHVLDLLAWWCGEPDSIVYEDDALGGLEVNCRIRLRLQPGFEAVIRLSRDWSRPNVYLIQGTKGWLRWEATDGNHIQVGIKGSRSHLDGALRTGEEPMGSSKSPPAAHFEQSFIEQIRNVIAAIRGREPLLVSVEDGLRSLRLVEDCYRRRSLLPMPWLNQTEETRARELAAVTESR